MTADALATQGARASAAVVLTWLSIICRLQQQNILMMPHVNTSTTFLEIVSHPAAWSILYVNTKCLVVYIAWMVSNEFVACFYTKANIFILQEILR